VCYRQAPRSAAPAGEHLQYSLLGKTSKLAFGSDTDVF
jgi:hypothetical protein